MFRLLVSPDLSLARKCKGVLALLTGDGSPLGWLSYSTEARAKQRARRRKIHAGFKRILLSKQLHLALCFIVVIVILTWLIRIGHNRDWSGWKNKTLWDWMALFIVPLTLAITAYLFSRQDRKADRLIAAEQHQQGLLQDYFDRISKLLIDKQLESPQCDDRIKAVAHVLTLAVLRQADTSRRAEILRFLYEAKLIRSGSRIIDLHDADFSRLSLPEVNLADADLSGAILTGSCLEGAILERGNLSEVNLDDANLTRANLKAVELRRARLTGTNFSDAILSGVKLTDADLYRTRFDYADLSSAQFDCTKFRKCSFRYASLLGSQCIETVTMLGCDFRNASFARSKWPDSGQVNGNRFKNASYDRQTVWPHGSVPPGAVKWDWLEQAMARKAQKK